MKTNLEDIVDVGSIGEPSNPISLKDLLVKATGESLPPAEQDKTRVLLLCIDMQQDFMEKGSLGVAGSHGDVKRLCGWMYDNMAKITKVAISLDTHNPFAIFHPAWWIDAAGNNPPPFTPITLNDLDEGKWFPVIHPRASREYVENIEKLAKKTLMIWPYHCLDGTTGHALENQLGNMIYFQSVAKKSIVECLIKGIAPTTERYGILKAEYDPKNVVSIDFLNKIAKYDMIVIAGEAKSHCVLESIKQIGQLLDVTATSKIYILEDCMSPINGFEAATDAEFDNFKTAFKMNIVDSTSFAL